MKYLALATVLLFLPVADSHNKLAAQPHQAPALLMKGVGCLVRQDWVIDELGELGLHVGDFARIRYRLGTIPGTSPQARDVVNIIVYSQRQERGLMLFFRQGTDGGVTVIGNAYRITHSSSGWAAGEGNGGVGTYKAVGDYARDMATQPARRVKLEPSGESCSFEQ